MTLDLPASHIAEVNLFGTGGGYGESMVIHLGAGKWMIVDSCYNPKNKKSLALQYLQDIKVPMEDVVLILCTHWHADHIRGISQVVAACTRAVVAFAWAHDASSFTQMVQWDYQPKEENGYLHFSAIKELKECKDILMQRPEPANWRGIRIPSIDKLLFRDHYDTHPLEVIALSPTDNTLRDFLDEVSSIGEKLKHDPAMRIPLIKPNALSVVSYLKLGHHRILLGADLEGSMSSGDWAVVLQNSISIKDEPPVTLFKIPHHGSANAYYPLVWQQLISSNAVAALTPWNLNGKLPTPEMLQCYQEHAAALYITCLPAYELSKREKRLVDAFSKIPGMQYTPVHYDFGHIRARIDIRNEASVWEIALRGSAAYCGLKKD